MTVKTIPAERVAVLRTLAAAGDMTAMAIVSLFDTDMQVMQQFVDPAAKSATAVHADVYGDAVGPVTVSTGLSNPAMPRNVTATFGADWDGGNVTVTGTNQFGESVSETLVASVGATVVGVKIFKTISKFEYAGGGTGTHATNVVSIGTGDKFGLSAKATQAFGTLGDSTPTAMTPVAIDTTYHAVTLSPAPNGTLDFTVSFSV